MEGKFQTSFIPKKPIVSDARTRSSGISLFTVVSIFIFVVSLVSAGLVFVGQKYLSDQLAKDKESFKKAQEIFDPITVDTLVKVDRRIESAKKILSKHIAILPIFEYLESKTLKNIRFKSMDLLFSENGVAELDMKGEAKNFSAVALQSDVFAESKELKNPIISDIDLNLTGGITFSFKTQVEPSAVLYRNVRQLDNNVENN